MGLEWVGRIPKPPMEDVVKSALGIETEGYTHQLYFRYPLHGGFESRRQGDDQGPRPGPLRHARSSRSARRATAGRSSTAEGAGSYDHLVDGLPDARGIRCFANVPAEVQDAVRRPALQRPARWRSSRSTTSRSWTRAPSTSPTRRCSRTASATWASSARTWSGRARRRWSPRRPCGPATTSIG